LLQNLGVLALAPILALLLRRRHRARSPTESKFAGMCLGLAAGACALWVIVQFGAADSITVIHVGSLAVPMLAIMGCVTALAATSLQLAEIVVGVNVLLVLALYTPALSPLPGGTRFSYVFAAAALTCLAGFIAAALHPSTENSATLPLDPPHSGAQDPPDAVGSTMCSHE
jgi:hypothetical protein